MYHQLLPLLLASLGSEDAGLSHSTLEGLLPLIQDAPSAVSDHVNTLIPRVLALASTADSMVSQPSVCVCVCVCVQSGGLKMRGTM